MIASQVYNSNGSYLSDGKRSFISIKPKRKAKINFVAYCADFGKDNPGSNESFNISESPESLKTVMRNITNHARQNPNADITVSAQVAVWLAQGESSSEIRKKFKFTSRDESLARSFLH